MDDNFTVLLHNVSFVGCLLHCQPTSFWHELLQINIIMFGRIKKDSAILFFCKTTSSLGCTVLFCLVSWNIFDKFWSHQTTVTTTSKLEDKIATPLFVLCSQHPFVDPSKTAYLSLEEFESNTVDIFKTIQVSLGNWNSSSTVTVSATHNNRPFHA